MKRCKKDEHDWQPLFEPPHTTEQLADRYFNPASHVDDNAKICTKCSAIGVYSRANRGRTIRSVTIVTNPGYLAELLKRAEKWNAEVGASRAGSPPAANGTTLASNSFVDNE